MSSVLLTSSGADALVTANPDPELKQILPTAPSVSRAFSREETLTWFTEVYDTPARRRAPSSSRPRCAMPPMDEQSFRRRIRRAVQPGERVRGHGFSTQLPLKNLNVGSDVLRVEATDAGHSARREVPSRFDKGLGRGTST